MHLYRRSLRHAAWMVLAVWVFALGAGVANACLSSAWKDSGHASPPTVHQDTRAHADQHQRSDLIGTECLKFCDEASQAIVKLDQPISDGGPGLSAALYDAWAPAVAGTTVFRLPALATRAAHLALPMAARPHRLTL